MACEIHEADLREVQRQREVLVEALIMMQERLAFAASVVRSGEQFNMEDERSMDTAFDKARTALRAIGRTP